ncbi:uncharacterized protein G2W53_014887 [Senna tora]|uniref:Uncharacterized protein n=1 Tax=Senna tora TaxID=362788 RepID=A0A834WU72_9FABA|nr:uncharacterized protein G2W53_014887 [Senna tora]
MELLSIEDSSPTVDVATVVFDGGHSDYLFDGGWSDGGGAFASLLLSVLCFASMISRCRHLVATDLAGENAEVLRESEGEEASAAAEEEVFGLEEDPWPPDRSLGAVVSLHQISRRRHLVAADLAGENTEVLRESEGEEASAAAEEEVFGLEDTWPPDRSLGAVVSLHQIFRRRRLVTTDLAGENAEVLWESEGQEASAAAEEEVFGLEEDPWPPDRSLGAVVSLHQISRRCRLVAADLARENAEVLRESEEEEASAAAEEEVFADLAGENAEVLRESEGEEASAAVEEEMFGLELSEGNLLVYSV